MCERPAMWTQTNSTDGWPLSAGGRGAVAVITSAFGCGEFGQEATDAGVDVVADQAHPLDAVNAAFGGFIGNPGFDRASHGLDRFDFGFVAEHDNAIHSGQYLRVDMLGGLV